MREEHHVVPDPIGSRPRSTGFALRLAENFFRRWYLYLLPIVLIAALGLRASSNITPSYESTAVLSAASNVFVSEQEVRGTDRNPFETAAQATARSINEQLFTDAFITGVAERAGLSEPVGADLLTLDDIRGAVGANATGDFLLTVTASWDDPETAFQLTNSTVTAYQALLEDILVEDVEAAVAFYRDRLAEAEQQSEEARAAYDAFVEQLPDLPDDVELPLREQLELQRLDDRLTEAETDIDATRGEIDDAELAVVQARSEAGQSLRLVDAATVPDEPESTATQKLTVLGAFIALGGLIAGGALILATRLDQSVRSAHDVAHAGAGPTLAAVPRVRALRKPRRRRSEPTADAATTRPAEVWPAARRRPASTVTESTRPPSGPEPSDDDGNGLGPADPALAAPRPDATEAEPIVTTAIVHRRWGRRPGEVDLDDDAPSGRTGNGLSVVHRRNLELLAIAPKMCARRAFLALRYHVPCRSS